MNKFQFHINAIPAVLYELGLRDVVISPGSRNAPLIMAFVRFGKFRCISSLDERSAAFVALGIAKQNQSPCAVICTSGSALANFYPAVLEAHYAQVPLLLISADRPSYMIDRWDGQTIHQSPFFSPHIKASFQLHEFSGHLDQDLVEDACHDLWKASMEGVKGPAHLNVPMAEPLYAAVNDTFDYPVLENRNYKVAGYQKDPISNELYDRLNSNAKVMILLGEGRGLPEIGDCRVFQQSNTIVLSDLLSENRRHDTTGNWELLMNSISNESAADWMPDILISAGKMVLNKKLKQLLRTCKPSLHLHIEPNGYCADTFFSQPSVLKINPSEFFNSWPTQNSDSGYRDKWIKLSEKRKKTEETFDFMQWSELTALKYISENLNDVRLHVSNSMTIRNMALLGHYLNREIKVYGNRGVSGIDGCTSTAMGMAMALPDEKHLLITGDLAFIYDGNAFLNTELPENLKIVVINNNGGGIFRMIDGPSGMKELDPFLTTPHNKDISKLAEFHQLNYIKCTSMNDLQKEFDALMQSDGLSIMEIETDQIRNTQVYNQFKSLNIW